MATKLEAFPPRRSDSRKTIYPWHEWEDGSIWQLERDRDYTVTDETMRALLHGRAPQQSGKRVITALTADGLAFQFVDRA